ncbi:MAG: hypothetical protein GY847_09385 [Proteobacteria bacterium]|nr:hypothetical protein [Pseudomonadota bacterium]
MSVILFMVFFYNSKTALSQTEVVQPNEPVTTEVVDPQAPAETSTEAASPENAAGPIATQDNISSGQVGPPAAPSTAPSTEASSHTPVDLAYEPRPLRVPGRGLRIAGASVLGAGYGASLIMGLFMIDLSESDGAYYCIPLVGGYIMGGKVAGDVGDEGEVSIFMLASFPSIVQTAGLFVLIAGIIKGKRWKNKHPNATIASFVPVGPNGTPGLSVSGHF